MDNVIEFKINNKIRHGIILGSKRILIGMMDRDRNLDEVFLKVKDDRDRIYMIPSSAMIKS